MNKRVLKKIAEGLKSIKEGDLHANHGICINLYIKVDPVHLVSDFLEAAFIQKFGSGECYPIEGSYDGYLADKDKWNPETEFGKKRIELLDFLIQYCNSLVHV